MCSLSFTMFFCNQKKTTTPVRVHEAIRAFTLIELMVSMSIVVMVTSVMMVRQSAFNGAVLLRNQAYEVAFALRQAQILAVSGVNDGASVVAQQYGVRLNKAVATNQTYQMFHDKDADGQSDPGEEYGLLGRLDRRFEIRDVVEADGDTVMGVSGILNIFFTRPNFDAKFENGNSGIYNSGPVYIVIAKRGSVESGNGTFRCVEVSGAGQIQVMDCP